MLNEQKNIIHASNNFITVWKQNPPNKTYSPILKKNSDSFQDCIDIPHSGSVILNDLN